MKTIQSWIGILASSYIIFLLRPYHRNYNKVVVKRPKLYFYDTGLAASLMGIKEADQIRIHPLYGALFETCIVSEMMKMKEHLGIGNSLFYWRDKTGHEIDLIIEKSDQLIPIEIKAGKTIHNEFFRNLKYFRRISGAENGMVIYAGDMNQTRSDGSQVLSWKSLSEEILI